MTTKTDKLVHELIERENAKHDEIAPARAVVCGPQGFLFKGHAVALTDTATKQLCATCGIPAPFFIECMTPQERCSVFNRLNLEQPETERMYRFHDDIVYGVVSERYKKIDNIRVLDVLEAATDSGIGLKPVRWTLSHDHTRVTLVPEKAGVGELTPSITITNSENGLGSLSLWAGVYRWVCSNGLMIPVSDVTRSRWMHLGNNDITLPDIRIVLNKSLEFTERLESARTRYLTTDDKILLLAEVAGALGQKVASRVADAANDEYRGAPTMFHAVNAVSRAAQSFPPAKQSQIEQYASSLLAA